MTTAPASAPQRTWAVSWAVQDLRPCPLLEVYPKPALQVVLDRRTNFDIRIFKSPKLGWSLAGGCGRFDSLLRALARDPNADLRPHAWEMESLGSLDPGVRNIRTSFPMHQLMHNGACDRGDNHSRPFRSLISNCRPHWARCSHLAKRILEHPMRPSDAVQHA